MEHATTPVVGPRKAATRNPTETPSDDRATITKMSPLAVIVGKAKRVRNNERYFNNLALVTRIKNEIRDALEANPESEDMVELMIDFELQRDLLDTFAAGVDRNERAARGPLDIREDTPCRRRPASEDREKGPATKERPRSEPDLSRSPVDEAFSSVPVITATPMLSGPDGRMYSTVVRGGLSTRDSVKRRALGFARTANEGDVAEIPVQILEVLHRCAEKLPTKCPVLPADYGPGARFRFVKRYVEYAESRKHLVRSLNPTTPKEAKAMFAAVTRTPRLILSETQRRHLSSLPEDPLENIGEWIFMTGKFDVDDKIGDFKAALAEIERIRFARRGGSIIAASAYFQKLESALAKHNCFPKKKSVLKAVEKAVEAIGSEELSKNWRCAWDEWKSTSGAADASEYIRSVEAVTLSIFRNYESQRSTFFRLTKPRKTPSPVDPDASARGVRTRGSGKPFREPPPDGKLGRAWKDLPPEGKAFYKDLVVKPRRRAMCWFCSDTECFARRLRQNKLCEKTPKWFKKVRTEDRPEARLLPV